jgi:hypothetical protein
MRIELLFRFYDREYLIWSLVCKEWHNFLKKVEPITSTKHITNVEMFRFLKCPPDAAARNAIKLNDIAFLDEAARYPIIKSDLLNLACVHADEKIYLKLLSIGCPRYFTHCINLAVFSNNVKLTRFLLFSNKSRICINDDLMRNAIVNGYFEIIEILCRKGVRMSAQNVELLFSFKQHALVDLVFNKLFNI